MTEEKWGQLRDRLLKTVGGNNYKTWIAPLEFSKIEDGVALFNVPTNFMGNYVSQNFADLILYELNTSGESVQRVAFKVAANKTVRPARSNSAAPARPVSARSSSIAETLAAAPLDRAVELDPEYAYPHLCLGVLYMEFLGELGKARTQLRAYNKLGGEDPRPAAWLRDRVR